MYQPTLSTERYRILDMLRGFALLGVILANMSSHSGYFFLTDDQKAQLPTAGVDHGIMWVLHFLIEGKFYSIFSLLFGIGFALQLKRSRENNINFAGRFSKRIFILFLIGLVHAVFFYVGDILTVYAITAIFLLLFRKASDKTLLKAALVFICLPILQYLLIWIPALINPPAPPPAPDPTAPRFIDFVISQYQTGSFIDTVKMNMGGLVVGRWPDLLFTGRLFKVMAMFLVGYYVTRKMIYANLSDYKPLLKKVMRWGAIIGIPCNIALAFAMESDAYYVLAPRGIIEPIVYGIGVPALALCYASALALLYEKTKERNAFRIFIPVGQMALTNYFMQSVICSFIFKSYGFGYFAKLGPLTLLGIGILIFIFQIIFSHWWLKHWRFGPLEWLWRSATYGKWQSMKKEEERRDER